METMETINKIVRKTFISISILQDQPPINSQDQRGSKATALGPLNFP